MLHVVGELDDCVQGGYMKLACGNKLPVISGACSNARHTSNKRPDMPIRQGKLGEKMISTLRDTGCSGVVVRSGLVTDSQYTGKSHMCLLIDGTVRKVPVAKIQVDTPYYVGDVEALCMKKTNI